MLRRDTRGVDNAWLEHELSSAWAKYQMANELLEQAQPSQALALLAQAETIFRTYNDARGLWRTLIGQSLLHWREGMAAVAEARGLAALQAAEATDDGFAVGYVTWQLATMKIEQAQYAQAADYLDQAQLALDAVGLAPAGGVIAAAAQLCVEIVRWQQMRYRQQIGMREAEAAVSAICADLSIRLRQAASAMQIVATQEHPGAAGGGNVQALAPMELPPAEEPSLPWIGLSAWLGRLWHKLVYGDDPATVQRVMRAPVHMPNGETLSAASNAATAVDLPAGLPQFAQDAPEITLQPKAPNASAGSNARVTQLFLEQENELGVASAPDLDPLLRAPSGSALVGTAQALPTPNDAALLEATEVLTTGWVAPKIMAPNVERASLALDVPPGDALEGREPAKANQPSGPSLSARLFGPFLVEVNGCAVENWSSGRGRAVFKYLLTHRERPLARDVLMDVFWPEATPDSARNSLNVAMYGLRQALRAAADVPVVMFQNGAYRLNPELQISLDVEEFKRCVQSGRRSEEAGDLQAAAAKFEQAAELYRGDFLSDDLADDWPVLPRERLRVDYLDTLDRLSHIYFTQEQYSSCIVLCQMILAEDNCREDVHCRLILCYSRLNQHHLALRQYQTCAEALERELGVAPAASTTQLYERIRRRETV